MTSLIDPLADIYRDKSRSEDEHRIALTALADYAHDRPNFLLEFLLDADPKSFLFLYPFVAIRGPDVLDELKAIVSRPNDSLAGKSPKHAERNPTRRDPAQPKGTVQDAVRRARSCAAAALIRLGHAHEVWHLLVYSTDPRSRSEIVTSLIALGVEAAALLDELIEQCPTSQRTDDRSGDRRQADQLPLRSRDFGTAGR